MSKIINAKLRILFIFYTSDLAHKVHCEEFVRMSFIGPLGETGQADYDVFWYGPWMSDDWVSINWLLFCRCMEYRPDVVMLINGWLPEHDEKEAWRPRLFTFYLIRKLLGVKVTALWTDQARNHFKLSDDFTRFCDVVFTHEDQDLFRNHSSFPEKHVITHATFSPKLLHASPLSRREVDLAFVGQVSGYNNDRSIGLAALRDSGLEVTTPGGQGKDQKRLSCEEYADFFKRSKIIINWSRHISGGWYQAKARIFEATLAGAMLLCEECKEVNRYFQPYVDYVPFSNTEQLVQRARYYLEHEEERLKIAIQGNRTALTKYSADVVWGQMLREIRDRSLHNEAEAVEGLRQNASRNELKVARFFQRELKKQFPQFDQSVVDAAVAIVEKGHKPYMRKARWQRVRRELHWRRVLRRLLPSFITRDSLRSLLRGGSVAAGNLFRK